MWNQKLTQDQKIDFMKKAAFVANEASCGYKVGCVGVIADTGQKLSSAATKDKFIKQKNGYIYVKSFNQTLPGEKFCQSLDSNGKRLCIREKENLKGRDFHKVCSSHAEIGLIAKCAKHAISTNEMILFITNSPCYVCAKALVQAGFSEVYYMAKHTDESGLDLLEKNNLNCVELSNTTIFEEK